MRACWGRLHYSLNRSDDFGLELRQIARCSCFVIPGQLPGWVGRDHCGDDRTLRGVSQGARTILCIECYPGVFEDQVEQALAAGVRPGLTVRTSALFKSPREVDALVAQYLGDDPVFGRMNDIVIHDFFNPRQLTAAR